MAKKTKKAQLKNYTQQTGVHIGPFYSTLKSIQHRSNYGSVVMVDLSNQYSIPAET